MFWACRDKPCCHCWPWLRAEAHPTPAWGESSGRVISSHVLTAAVPGRDKPPSPTLRSPLWPRESKQAEATHKTFTSCCKHHYPVFLPGCCSPCAFPSPLAVGQVLCCATLPKLLLPSFLWLRGRWVNSLPVLRVIGKVLWQQWGRLGKGTAFSDPKCHFWSRVSSKIGISFHEVFKESSLVPAVTMSPFHQGKTGIMWVNVIMMFLTRAVQRKLFYCRMLPNRVNIDLQVKH